MCVTSLLSLYAELTVVCSLLAILKIVSVKIKELKEPMEVKNKAKLLLWNGFERSCLLAVIFLSVLNDTAVLGLNLDFNWINFI